MMRLLRGLGVLLFAGACLASLGCWDTEEEGREEAVKPQPVPTDAAAVLRERAFAAYHDRCVELFVKAEDFGVRRMPTVTHRLRDYPRSLQLPSEPRPGTPSPEAATSTWLMQKVELVSLLKHGEPGVYPAEGKMGSGLRRPKVRDLDEFEKRALADLQEGEQVRLTEASGTVRLLGALRARSDCLKCHSDKKEGDLLGALSYAFEQAKP